MSQRNALLALLLVVGLVFAAGACRGGKDLDTEPAPPPPPPPVEERQPEPREVEPPPVEKPIEIAPQREPSIDELNAQGLLKTVYFDFDKYDLTTTTRATLRMNADWLRANPGYRVVIEGHCDERGTIEYNLALGEKRANATREFLASLGVDTSALRIVSYGEERPAVDGRGEFAWSKNRRAEFVIESKR
jgi:peptidoglycan-associated lipoprotein